MLRWASTSLSSMAMDLFTRVLKPLVGVLPSYVGINRFLRIIVGVCSRSQYEQNGFVKRIILMKAADQW